MYAISMTLELLFPVALYDDPGDLKGVEVEQGNAWYTWHTEGRENWLERGLSIVNALGYVQLPACLPEQIDMPPDEPNDGENAGD